MKKILLGTTTLIGAVSLFAGAASAESPKITLGLTSDFQVGYTSEDDDSNLRSGAFRSDNEVNIDFRGVADNGLAYGGAIILEADVDGSGGRSFDDDNGDTVTTTGFDNDNQGFNAARTYVFVEGTFGRVQGGSDLGVTNTMKVDASRIARATGGVDGDFRYFLTSTTGQVIATPDLMLDYGSGQLGNESQENINKITYYTPRFSGFQAGVSYLFDTTGADRGQGLSRADNTSGEAENVVLGAISYDGKFDQIGFAAAATMEWGDSEVASVEDLFTWQAGAKVTYMGWSVAGSYGDWGDSLRASSATDDSWFWTAGVSYETGPWGLSVTYLDSTYEASTTTENDFTNISVGADYKLAPGFTPYVEVNFIDLDPTGTANDNDATVGIVGATMNF